MATATDERLEWANEARRLLQLKLKAAQQDAASAKGSDGYVYGLFGFKAQAANYQELVNDAAAKKKLADADTRVGDLYQDVLSKVRREPEEKEIAPLTARYKDACAASTVAVGGKESDMIAAAATLAQLELDLQPLLPKFTGVVRSYDAAYDSWCEYNDLETGVESRATALEHRQLLGAYRIAVDAAYKSLNTCDATELGRQRGLLMTQVTKLKALDARVKAEPADASVRGAVATFQRLELEVEELVADFSQAAPDVEGEQKHQQFVAILAGKSQPPTAFKKAAQKLETLHKWLEKEVPKRQRDKTAYERAHNAAVELIESIADVVPRTVLQDFDKRFDEYALTGDARRKYAVATPKFVRLNSEMREAQSRNRTAASLFETDVELFNESLKELASLATPTDVNTWGQKLAEIQQAANESLDFTTADNRLNTTRDGLLIAIESSRQKQAGWLAAPLRVQVKSSIAELAKKEQGAGLAKLLAVDLALADRLAKDGQFPKAQAALESLAQCAGGDADVRIAKIEAAGAKYEELRRQFTGESAECQRLIGNFKTEVAKKDSTYAAKNWNDTQLGKECRALDAKAASAIPLIDAASVVGHFEPLFVQLRALKTRLDTLFDSSGAATGAMSGAVDGAIEADKQDAAQRALLTDWERERGATQDLLSEVGDMGSKKQDALAAELLTQEQLAKAGKYAEAVLGIAGVKQKIVDEKDAIVLELGTLRGELTGKISLLRTKITDFDKRPVKDVVLAEYYKSIDDELKPIEKQTTTNSVDTLKFLTKKVVELADREAIGASQHDAIKAALAKFNREVRVPLNDPALGKFTPNRLQALQAEVTALEGNRLKLDPAKLSGKVDVLKTRVSGAIDTAKQIGLDRVKVTEAAKIVKTEFAALGAKMDQAARARGVKLPRAKDYAELQVEAESYKTQALASEDPARVALLLSQLEELVKQIRSAEPLSDDFATAQLEKLQAQRTQDIRAERARQDFSAKLQEFLKGPSYAAAKQASDQTAYLMLERLRENAQAASDQGDFAAARTTLRVMEQTALRAADPAQGLNKDLRALGVAWKKALHNLQTDVTELVSAVEALAATYVIEPKVIAACQKFPAVLSHLLPATRFDAHIETLSKAGTERDKLAARERLLAAIRTSQRRLTSDPLLPQLASNPLGKKIRVSAAHRALKQLHLNVLAAG